MINLEGIPTEPIIKQLAALVATGMSGDDAAERVVAPYRPAPAAEFMWPAVRNAALDIERQHHRKVEDAALGPAGQRAKQEASLRLPKTTFRLGNGQQVVWDDATRDQHMMRVAWQQGQIAAIGLDIDRHVGSVELIDEYGVTCLREIPDWVQKLDELLAAKRGGASAEADVPARSTARKPVTRGNKRRGGDKAT